MVIPSENPKAVIKQLVYLGSLRSVWKNMLKESQAQPALIQKITLLGTAHILRKVLSIK